jgi:hypothetical protein
LLLQLSPSTILYIDFIRPSFPTFPPKPSMSPLPHPFIFPSYLPAPQVYDKTVLPPVMSLVKELIAISNALSSRAGAGAGAGGPSIDSVDGGDDDEAQMMAALQAAMGGAAPSRG